MINLEVGVTYSFSFKDNFQRLNGVYSLNQIMTFRELVDSGIDLLESCFKLVEYTETKYSEDIIEIKNNSILKLSDPDTNEVKIYIPEIYLSQVPDHNVAKYFKLALGINVGYLKNSPRLEAMIEAMREHVIAATGFDTLPDIFELTSRWMSESQYQEYEELRDKTKMKAINYFTENKRLRDEITKLKSKVIGYEEKFKTLHSKGII